MAENYYGYPEEERDKDPSDEIKRPDQREDENPLKQISGKPQKPRSRPELYKRKF